MGALETKNLSVIHAIPYWSVFVQYFETFLTFLAMLYILPAL